MLGGIAVAYHGLLDLHGLVLIHGHTRLLDCQQNDAPGLSNLNAGCDIVAKEQLFNGHGIGLGLISYSVLKLCTGKGKDVSVLTYVISVIFLVKFFLVA